MFGVGICRHLCSMGGTTTARSGGSSSSAVTSGCRSSRSHLDGILCRCDFGVVACVFDKIKRTRKKIKQSNRQVKANEASTTRNFLRGAKLVPLGGGIVVDVCSSKAVLRRWGWHCEGTLRLCLNDDWCCAWWWWWCCPAKHS